MKNSGPRLPWRAGTREVRALIAELAFTRSHAERMLAHLLRRAGLPRPAFNSIVEGFEVDAAWRIERVILEVDGHAFHAARAAFERDCRRDPALGPVLGRCCQGQARR
jgi:very-short-patch-repair endonuclease